MGLVIFPLLAVYLLLIGEHERKGRNEESIRTIRIALLVSVANQMVYPNELGDLLEYRVFDQVPLYENRDGSMKPFVYAGAGNSDSENGNMVILAGPETEPDGKVLVGINDGTLKYLSPADAGAALEEARANGKGFERRPRTAAPSRGQ